MLASAESLDVENDQSMVREIVKTVMILDRSKKPFKYSDLFSNMNPKPSRKKGSEIFEEARDCLENLGLNLHEAKNTPHKMYFVTSEFQPLESMYNHAPEEEVSDRILLTFVLTFIFMKNGVVTSDRLFGHLQLLGIYKEANPVHPYFGNVKKKVMSDFVDQLYLSMVRVSVEPDVFEVKWGQRAEIELSKRAILEFICKQGFKGKVKPQEHTSHYEQVLLQEKSSVPTEEVEEVVMQEESESSDDDSDVEEVAPQKRRR